VINLYFQKFSQTLYKTIFIVENPGGNGFITLVKHSLLKGGKKIFSMVQHFATKAAYGLDTGISKLFGILFAVNIGLGPHILCNALLT
jgi:hypothetical protein